MTGRWVLQLPPKSLLGHAISRKPSSNDLSLLLTKRLQWVDAYRALCRAIHCGERDGDEDGNDPG